MPLLTLLDLDEPSTRDHVTKCAACKHTLKTPESRALGIGPTALPSWGLRRASQWGSAGGRELRWDCEGQTDLLEEAP
ncbi:DUF6011 domain-containing protein [Nonomuraea polychroma]|uniref:DUF6011 domain-containing protein n=1 Tax=Nonomuraea polychroma TaxID=46176 RepID=UPI003D8E421C